MTRTRPGTAAAPPDSWTVSIYRAGGDGTPLGAGVVIDRRRVLTCAHVVAGRSVSERSLEVAFPKATGTRPIGVARVRTAPDPDTADVAVLELDVDVPPAVDSAPLRSPPPRDLVDERWWAFGFPRDARLGSEASGTVGAVLSYGWVRLDTDSRYGVTPGFSGAGLWSPQFGAVVGLVGLAQRGGEFRGDAQALTLHEISRVLPDERLERLTAWSLEAAGETAHSAWGWSLATDPEAGRHWYPRARGVSSDSERGFRFRGRRAALTKIVEWLERTPPDRRVLVITGSPGVGKSAVLGRIVTTADPEISAILPPDDNVRAEVGAIACAVHVKGKSALDVAAEIARAASIWPGRRLNRTFVEALPKALRAALEQRPGPKFSLVIDALDEATSPTEARQIVTLLILPIAETCASAGAQIVVGTRRTDDGGELVGSLGAAAQVVDLDAAEYFEEEDLAAYARATLARVGDEREGNPYVDEAVALPVARRIAAKARGNFLIAGLVARTHGLYDREAVLPDELDFTATVHAALTSYLERLPQVTGVPASLVLTALAYAQPPGFSTTVWRTALAALDIRVGHNDLLRFTESSAANFLIESVRYQGTRCFRLFHQALNDALIHEREKHGGRFADEHSITRAMIDRGQRFGWRRADGYLLECLPVNAERAELIDELLTDDEYLLYADLERLTPLAQYAHTEPGRARARLLRLTPQAIGASPEQRIALLSVAETLEQFGDRFAAARPAPYRARWASVNRRIEQVILEGHLGSVRDACTVPVAGTTKVATAGDDRTVRLWDLATGRHQATLRHAAPVLSVCPVRIDGRTWLASASRDNTVRLWDPVTGHHERLLVRHPKTITGMAETVVAGQSVLAIGCGDGTLLVLEPATGRQWGLRGHDGAVTAIAAATLDDQRSILVTGGEDRVVRVWDLATRERIQAFVTSIEAATAVCCVAAGTHVYAVAATFRTIWLWDIATPWTRAVDKHSQRVRAICSIEIDGRAWVASAGDERVIYLWLPEEGEVRRTLSGHPARVNALASAVVDGRPTLISAGHDRTARVWNPEPTRAASDRGEYDQVNSLCVSDLDGQVLVASAAISRRIGVWDARRGRQLQRFLGHIGGAFAICAVRTRSGDVLFATAGNDTTIRVWNPFTGLGRVLIRRSEGVRAMCTTTRNGRDLLATAGFHGAPVQLWTPDSGRRIGRGLLHRMMQRADERDHVANIRAICALPTAAGTMFATASGDHTVWLWHESTARPLKILTGHSGPVNAVHPLVVDGQLLLASAADDRTVRLWEPFAGTLEATLTGHVDAVSGVCAVTVGEHTQLASVSHDRTVRIWNLASETTTQVIPLHHPAFACVSAGDLLVVGLSAGVLALQLNDPVEQRDRR